MLSGRSLSQTCRSLGSDRRRTRGRPGPGGASASDGPTFARAQRSSEIDSSDRRNRPGNPGWPLSRGDEVIVAPKREARRIVVVGDSFTWGDGVEPQEAYPSVMESLLRERWPEKTIEVINWSRPGWNTWREFKSIGPQLPRLDPDLLIIGYCINDAEPIHRRQLRELRHTMRTAQRQPSDQVVVWLYNHSYVGALVYDFFENRRLRKAVTSYYQTLYDAGRSGWVRTQTHSRYSRRPLETNPFRPSWSSSQSSILSSTTATVIVTSIRRSRMPQLREVWMCSIYCPALKSTMGATLP